MSETQSFDQIDWRSGSSEEHLAMARKASEAELRQLARRYDWTAHPETVLGWVMAQKCIDLGAALCAFFNGEPERFNYMPKRDVPTQFHGAARVLDNICLRVNSGFYLVWPGTDAASRERIERWLALQVADRAEGRQGRWILDETIVAALLDDALRLDPAQETAVYSESNNLLRDLFSPVLELGVSRRVLRFLPPEYHPRERSGPDDLSKLEF